MRGVVTLAGEGTRMLPVTRGLRKELLPLFYRGRKGVSVLAPVADLVVRSLASAGVTNVTMVAGKDVEGVMRYFAPDEPIGAGPLRHPDRLAETLALNRLVSKLHFTWVVQSRPRGFGNAVLEAADTVGRGPFLLHAADAILLEPRRGEALRALADLLQRERAQGVLFVRKVKDPRHYGVVEGKDAGRFRQWSYLRVTGMEEKPEKPKSRWAATAMYAFDGTIFTALEELDGRERELEVTAGITRLLEQGGKVLALVSDPARESWVSVGSPEGYFSALRASYDHALNGRL